MGKTEPKKVEIKPKTKEVEKVKVEVNAADPVHLKEGDVTKLTDKMATLHTTPQPVDAAESHRRADAARQGKHGR
jgi:hypothetical protein